VTTNEHGVVFALDRYVDEIKNGDRPVEPLTLHANKGDCIEINLTNNLPSGLDNDHAHPKMRISQEWGTGRIGSRSIRCR